MKRSSNLHFTTAAGLVAALFFSIQVNAQETVRLQGHVLDVLPTAVHLTRSPQNAQESIALTLMLNWSAPAGPGVRGAVYDWQEFRTRRAALDMQRGRQPDRRRVTMGTCGDSRVC